MLAIMEEQSTKDLYVIKAEWNPSIGRWSAMSDDIPGLFLETGSLEELKAEIKDIVPVLLEMSEDIPKVPIFLQANCMERVNL